MTTRLDGASILVTGGTGSVGHQIVEALLRDGRCARIRVFSRGDVRQQEMASRFSDAVREGRLDFRVGDVRDREALRSAARSYEILIHAAALKVVPSGESNPMEYVKTNVIGSANVADVAIDLGCAHVVAISTEKANAPASVYGATKLCADRIMLAAGDGRDSIHPRFTVVRYGNVFGSSGSVVEVFQRQAATGSLRLTDPEMTRFTITAQEAMDHVLWVLDNAPGGEIIVPKCRSFRVADLAAAVAPDAARTVTGVRPGEKRHEELITEVDGSSTLDLGARFAILPSGSGELIEAYGQATGGSRVPLGFRFFSGDPEQLLSVPEIVAMLGDPVLGGTP